MSFRYAAGINKPGYNGLLVPDAPTIGTASIASATSVSVAFTAPGNVGAGVSSYTATSSPGGLTGSSATSPITVSGLTTNTAYTFTVIAGSAYGNSFPSAASNSVTPVAYQLWSWGRGSEGQLGLSNSTYYSSPKQVGTLTTWLNIAAGFYHTIATKLNGTLWSWGMGTSGRLGLGNVTNYSSPQQVGALTNWATVAAGSQGGLAVKTDGTFWSWGANSSGELGLGDVTNRSSPAQVGALTTWSQVAGGASFLMATKTDGTLWSSGYNFYGSLGLGTGGGGTNRSSPVQVGGLTNWLNIACGYAHTIATKTDGTLWSWGKNQYGQLGDGTATHRSSPVQVGALTTWSKVAAATSFSLAVKTNGTLWAWGYNNNGQLGLGNTTSYSSPMQVGVLTTWSIVISGGNTETVGFTLAAKTNGTLWSWGINSLGQLGLGNTTSYSSPQQVGALTTWSKIAGGGQFTLATKTP